MSLFARLALAALIVVCGAMTFPEEASAVCASGGTVTNVNDCTPGGRGGRDCFLEWSVNPVPPPDKFGFPTRKIECLDNDPACDADLTPGQCTFKIATCVNVTDPRLPCTATGLASLDLKKPSARDAQKPHKNPFNLSNRLALERALDANEGGLIPTAVADACSDEFEVVVPLKVKKARVRKGTVRVKARVVNPSNERDNSGLVLKCLPNQAFISVQSIATAKQITSAGELIGGPLAMGQVGDYLIQNDKVRYIIRDAGRDFSFMLTYGGHVIDADLQRDSGPGRDSFLAMTPLINISSTDNPTSVVIVNSGFAGPGMGLPAVIRTTGPDDLFDPIDPRVAIEGFNQALGVPASAIDKNLNVDIMNEYTLTAGDDFLEMETIVTNNAGTDLVTYFGDYVSAGGQFESVAPGMGFGEPAIRLGAQSPTQLSFDFLGYVGFGEAAGLSYGLVFERFFGTSSFGQSGVTVPIYGQSLVAVLLGGAPGVFTVPGSGGMKSYKRWFVVSENGLGAVRDARHKLVERGDIVQGSLKTGFVQGQVTVGGEPVDGARVVIYKIPGDRLAGFGLVSAFETSNGGYYQGTLPRGGFVASAVIPGHPYEGLAPQPAVHPISIGGATTVLDIDMPAAGWVRVTATDGVSTDPISAKVLLVGEDKTPQVSVNEDAILAVITGSLLSFDSRQRLNDLHGVPAYAFAGPSGDTGAFPVPPGDYQVVVSHGPEYSVSRTNLTVVAGDESTPQVVNATIVPVIDTTGFVSTDNHVHLINSPDSVVSRNERIISMLADGVDYFTATDHDFVTDLTADIAALGASSLIKTAPGDEITTFDSGHFNAYPLDLVPGSVTNGSVDWGREGEPPGLGYPSDGSYDLSPDEMATLAKGPPHNATVVQANHFNSTTLGYFRIHGIDTTAAPPQSSVSPSQVRLDPAITNTYTDEITALELWIENSRSQNARALGENLGDWFNMLNNHSAANPLLRKTAICDSDTHSTVVEMAGGPRTMVASSTDDPGLIDPDEIATNINDGRAVCTNGPFVRVSIEGDGGAVASHDLTDDIHVPATLGAATLKVQVQSPTWAEFDRIEIYRNNVPSCVNTGPNFVGASKKVCTATPNITSNPTRVTVPINGDFRIETSPAVLSFPLGPITTDQWVVVIVKGRDNVSKPMFPMASSDMIPRACALAPCQACQVDSQCFGPCNRFNRTRAELTDGNLNDCGVTALAISNPLYVDFEGDGAYNGAALP